MKDVSSSEANRELLRHSDSPDNRQTFSRCPEYLKADSWSILSEQLPVRRQTN